MDSLKILSWNIERPIKDDNRKDEIIEIIGLHNADLIFLTETNADISFENYYKLETKEQHPVYSSIKYQVGENKASIFSKYPIIETNKTYDYFSSVSGKIKTELGEIALYGSIIGFLGGRDDFFKHDLKNQFVDIKNLCSKGSLIFSGDLNIAYSGHPYPSLKVQRRTYDFFKSDQLSVTTEHHKDSAIHIVISDSILSCRNMSSKIIEIPRRLSDHNIVITEIN